MDPLLIALNRTAPGGLYRGLVESLQSAIERGDLGIGARLPSERDLAQRLGVSRTTVVNAYRELESRGLVRGHVGRGTFVCAGPEPPDAPFAWRGKVARGAMRTLDPSLADLMRWAADPDIISFAAGTPAAECFPARAFREVTARVLDRQTPDVIGHGATEGQPALRRAIAARHRLRPEQILVLSGSQQGLDLVTRCLLDPGDAVVMDRPGYLGAVQIFRAAGVNIVGWDIMRADLDELEDLLLRYRPKLIYTNPTFSNPTGRTLTLRERRGLLDLAARYRVPVIEDDAYRDLWLHAAPPPTLYHLDTHHLVIYLSTFAKVFAPGLRLGWLAASEAIVEQLALLKLRGDLHSANLGQLVVAEFITSGLLDEHADALRAEHARRLEVMERAIERFLPARALAYSPPEGGIYLWCRLRQRGESRALLQRATAEGVAFAGGEMFYPDECGGQELRLCYSSQPPERIVEGMRRLGAAMSAAAPRPVHDGLMRPVV